jgi:hypothetical protein
MKSRRRGKPTSGVEVTNISPNGLWLLLDEQEQFLPFDRFPWFADATIRQLTRVERPSPHHLYWPDLDVDLAVESILNPEGYPLVSRVQSKKQLLLVKERPRARKGARRSSRSRD